MDQPKIELININKKFGNKAVLEDVSCTIAKGEFIAMLGPSGCGKTTLLRIIMGLVSPDVGQVLKDGVDITTQKPSKRGMGIVFQNYALFPNMNVFDNIAFALRGKKMSKETIKAKVKDVIHAVGLEEHVFKKPALLSGGQQQRVAIARTLVLDPDVILFDEPMSALDEDIKMTLRKEIKRIQKELDVTMIYVTHDQEEAFALADRVMVMNDCRVVQFAAPKDIYQHPADHFVETFIIEHLDAKLHSIEEHTR